MHDLNFDLVAAGLQNRAQQPGGDAAFTVCDSAFEAGQRFVSIWQAWLANPRRTARLHYVGLAPLSMDAAQLASCWGQCASSAERSALLAHWVTPLSGVNRLEFDGGRVSLTLLHMPLKQAVVQLVARVNVFLLDVNMAHLATHEPGFSIFGQLVRVAAPGALVFAQCGDHREGVGRGLQRAGFVCEPVLLPSALNCGSNNVAAEPLSWLQARLRPGLAQGSLRALSDRRVAVIGGGIAGAGVAHALAQRGHEVHVFDRALGQSAQGLHEGHLGAAVTPAVSRDDDYRARLSRAGARQSWLCWQGLPDGARPLRTGTAVVPSDAAEHQRLHDALQAGGFPQSWAKWCRADDPAGAPGFGPDGAYAWFSEGMVIRPGRLVEALLAHPAIQVHPLDVVRVSGASGQWQLTGDDGQGLMQVPNVVFANAAGVLPLMRASGLQPLPVRLAQMQAIAGQVSYFDSSRFTTPARCVLDGDGYWLPPIDGLHVGGGTYELEAVRARVSAAGHEQVVDKVCAVLGLGDAGSGCPGKTVAGRAGLMAAVSGGWAGWRAVVPGRLPVVGELPGHPGVWLACGYGSRGLTWSALAGGVIAALLNDEPLPLERDLLRAISVR